MIVVSFVLILVAVGLLATGLTAGSSALLVCSIAASLLAAVALVAGARRTASRRREAAVRAGVILPEDRPVPALARMGGVATYAEAGPTYHSATRPVRAAAFGHSGADGSAHAEYGDGYGTGRSRRRRGVDAETTVLADAAYRESSPSSPVNPLVDGADPYDYEGNLSSQSTYAPFDDEHGDQHHHADIESDSSASAPRRQDDADYGRAADYIGAARSDTPGADAWRRDPGDVDERGTSGVSPLDGVATSRPDLDSGDLAGDDLTGGDLPGGDAGEADRGDLAAGGEFGEADEDDPADEPLPQAVKPADAVRVARLTADVHVVDGRPRYHLADCPHLADRETEPLPVAEAVELGFSPCGLCRPVDHLVAHSVRH